MTTASPIFSDRAFHPLRSNDVAESASSTRQFVVVRASRTRIAIRTRGLIHSTSVTVPRSVTRRSLSYAGSAGSAPEFDDPDIESTRVSVMGVFAPASVYVPVRVLDAAPIFDRP